MRLQRLLESVTDKDNRIVILLTSSKNQNNETMVVSKTLEMIKASFNKKGIKCYIVFANEAKIETDDTDQLITDKDGNRIRINPNSTLFIARRGVLFNKSSIGFITHIEDDGYRMYNTKNAMMTAEDKYLSAVKFNKYNIPSPKTEVINNIEQLDYIMDKLDNKYPVICKLLASTQGIGVFKCDSKDSLKSTLQTIWKLNSNEDILLQEMIKSVSDYRIHVINGEVVGGLERVQNNDFRSNVHLDATVKPLKINDEVKRIAKLAAEAIGGYWVGVDIIPDKDGNYYVLEINTSPGTEGIMKAGVDIISILTNDIDKNFNKLTISKEYSDVNNVIIEGVGELDALFDTGNRSKSFSLHCDDYSIKNDQVTFTIGEKKFTKKLIGHVKIKSNISSDKDPHRRPIVPMTISFNGITATDYPANLVDRSHKNHKVLINSDLITKFNISINPEL